MLNHVIRFHLYSSLCLCRYYSGVLLVFFGRSEENVSSLSKDIKNNQEFKRQVANQKLQDLQTENESLKLTLAEATTE